MTAVYVFEAVLIEGHPRYQLSDVMRLIGLHEAALMELIDCDLLNIDLEPDGTIVFKEQALQAVQRAARLAHDFELAPQGLALAVRLLARIDDLERQIASGHGAA